jgi:hypothetical protein
MSIADLPKPPNRPCGSCPYRKDAPSGLWEASEYEKLPRYDQDTMLQPPQLFMCHQRDGCLCAGWLQTHDTDHLLALRIHRVDPSAYGYKSDVETFSSGAEAAAHGMRDIDCVGTEAAVMITKLQKVLG